MTSQTENSLVAVVVGWCDRIQNGRDKSAVLRSIKEEVDELEDEVLIEKYGPDYPVKAGDDGVFGEAVDIIVSAIDMCRQARPDLTVEEIERELASYADLKCKKWAEKYG